MLESAKWLVDSRRFHWDGDTPQRESLRIGAAGFAMRGVFAAGEIGFSSLWILETLRCALVCAGSEARVFLDLIRIFNWTWSDFFRNIMYMYIYIDECEYEYEYEYEYIYSYTCMMHCHPIFVPSRLSLTGKGNILPTRKTMILSMPTSNLIVMVYYTILNYSINTSFSSMIIYIYIYIHINYRNTI